MMTTKKSINVKQAKRRERNHNKNLRYFLLSLNMLVMDAPASARKKSHKREKESNEVIKNSEHHNDTVMI